MNEEIWKPIPGYPGYEVSNMGRVRSFKWNDIRILKPASYHGYLSVLLSNQNKKSLRRIHQLVMLAFVGPCPDGLEVCHGPDNDRANNRLDNLRYDTHKANIKDCTDQNRMGNFTLKQVGEIRLKVKSGYSIKELAKEYNCRPAALYGVVSEGYTAASVPPLRIRELADERAKNIRIEYAGGDTSLSKLGKKYRFKPCTISRIVRGIISPDSGGPMKGIDY